MPWFMILGAAHLIGLIFGLGGVTATDIISAYGMHFKPETLPKAVGTFKLLSFMVWVGLFLLVSSGIVLMIAFKGAYGENLSSWQFYLKLGLVGVATLNGLFLTLVVTPAFEKAVQLADFTHTKEYRKATILGLISGGISFTSWWGAFFLAIWVFRGMV